MLGAIAFPAIDPVALSIGPVAIRWYALAYIAGLVLGWRYCLLLGRRAPRLLAPRDVDDLLLYATLGVILGGRFGYVLFYRPSHYLQNPLELFMVWQGGMAFHGGLIGVVLAIWLFARRRSLPMLAVGDIVAAAAPIGLFFGRIANFINGELFGRPSDLPWAVIFPGGGPVGRHPSQLYEALLEGLLLFAVLAALAWRPAVRACHGLLTGIFLTGYGLARALAELFRQPDAHIGFVAGSATMGQLLSVPLILVGLVLIRHGWRRPAAAGDV